MEKKRSTISNYLLLIIGFSLLFIIMMMFQSCSCGSSKQSCSCCTNQTCTSETCSCDNSQSCSCSCCSKKPAPVKIDSLIIEKKQYWNKYYGKLYVKESGMRYVIYSGTNTNHFQIVNITKDSLECLVAKQRLEIIDKYK